jgi:hypothetical protein
VLQNSIIFLVALALGKNFDAAPAAPIPAPIPLYANISSKLFKHKQK